MILRTLALVCLALGLVAGEAGDDPEPDPAAPFEHRGAGLVFPGAIGPLVKQGQREYRPATWGVGIRYESEAGVYVDCYVYDKDLDIITDGIAAEPVTAEFERSCGELQGMEKAGRYADVAVLPDPEVPRKEHFLLRSFSFRRVQEDREEPGPLLHSHVLLRGHNGHFLKVRLTYPAGAGEAGREALAAVVDELVGQLDVPH